MSLKTLSCISCISFAMAACAVPAAAAVAVARACPSGRVTAASYTWDFTGEANTLFKAIRSDAQQAVYHADNLHSFAADTNLVWSIHGEELDALKDNVGDIGAKLCRLEAIRRAVTPWQRSEIERIAVASRLMADNADNAILYGNASPQLLWEPAYRRYVNNLYAEAKSLARSVDEAVEFAHVSKQYRDLRQAVETRRAS